MTDVLEWWPDYSGQLLHRRSGRGGVPVDLDDLPLTASTADALRAWVATYSDEKLPSEGSGDPDWIGEGIGLLHRCRQELGAEYEVVVTEPWWGEPAPD